MMDVLSTNENEGKEERGWVSLISEQLTLC